MVRCGMAWTLRPEIFWHLTAPTDFLLHNVRLGRGWSASTSYIADIENNDGFVTPYSELHRDRAKERVWETVRVNAFPERPPRLKSLFAFASEADARTSTWFSQESRLLVQVQLSTDTAFHIADASHLESSEQDWPEKAHKYWSGEISTTPKLEVLIHGPVYFPGWREPPFGLAGQPSNYVATEIFHEPP